MPTFNNPVARPIPTNPYGGNGGYSGGFGGGIFGLGNIFNNPQVQAALAAAGYGDFGGGGGQAPTGGQYTPRSPYEGFLGGGNDLTAINSNARRFGGIDQGATYLPGQTFDFGASMPSPYGGVSRFQSGAMYRPRTPLPGSFSQYNPNANPIGWGGGRGINPGMPILSFGGGGNYGGGGNQMMLKSAQASPFSFGGSGYSQSLTSMGSRKRGGFTGPGSQFMYGANQFAANSQPFTRGVLDRLGQSRGIAQQFVNQGPSMLQGFMGGFGRQPGGTPNFNLDAQPSGFNNPAFTERAANTFRRDLGSTKFKGGFGTGLLSGSSISNSGRRPATSAARFDFGGPSGFAPVTQSSRFRTTGLPSPMPVTDADRLQWGGAKTRRTMTRKPVAQGGLPQTTKKDALAARFMLR